MKEKTRADQYNEKVRLIYEYDKSSPLFIRMAHIELQNNRIERAIDILNNGLKIYPYYAAAHLLLGKAFMHLGSYSHAIRAVKTGSELINSKKTFDFYFKEIELRRKQRSSFEITRRTSFLSPEMEMLEEPEHPVNISPVNEQENVALDDRLDELANDIRNIKLSDSTGSSAEIKAFEEMDHFSLIVSETLAQIYVAQGELNEAIDTYKKLIKKSPDKEEYYLGKIEELKKKLES